MNEWVLLIVGLIFGALVAWLVTSTTLRSLFQSRLREAENRAVAAEATAAGLRERQEKDEKEIEALRERLEAEQRANAAAQASREAERKNLEEQRKLLEDARQKLSETFRALSGDVLGSQSDSFLKLAKEAFGTLRAEADGDLAKRQEAIDGLVSPLQVSLERYEKQIQEMERAREKAYGSLEKELTNLAVVSQQLQKEAGGLVTALRMPQVRGRWGEMTLRRAVELAGMSEHCDFVEQETLTGEGGRLRPDMIVNLPGNRRIAVDAKVPLEAFLDAASATTEEDREAHLARHSQLVRSHMSQLAAKAYSEQFDQNVEIVALFLPGEAFFAAALQQDRTLIEDGVEKNVFLVTPTTLIALLRAIAYGWRQEQIEQNAQEISDLGKELYDRIKTFIDHYDGIRAGLARTVEAYNKATGSLENRVLVSARKFKELGTATGEEIIEVTQLDQAPRALATPESGEALPATSAKAVDAVSPPRSANY